jgi:ankyrin repeat protein
LNETHDIDSPRGYAYTTPLIIASKHGYAKLVKLVKFLLNQGAKVEAKNKYEYNTLNLAVCHGHTKVVEFLLDQSADPNSTDMFGETPLFDAAFRRGRI